MENLSSLLQEEKDLRVRIEAAVSDAIAAIKESITNENLEGVTPISGSPPISIVKFSTLSREGVWSPETFIPQSQADAVEKKLCSCSSGAAMVKAIQNMVDTRQVTVANNKIRLNTKTIEILQQALAQCGD